MGRGCLIPQLIRGFEEHRKFSQQGPEWSPSFEKLIWPILSTLCRVQRLYSVHARKRMAFSAFAFMINSERIGPLILSTLATLISKYWYQRLRGLKKKAG